MLKTLYWSLFLIMLNEPVMLSSEDNDFDGIDDRLELSLLEKFAPEFMLSTDECDELPAEFIPDEPAPELLEKNGTIYGQVFPVEIHDKSGFFIEVHYYHLWTRDCGSNGHPLDLEHVSVLLSTEEASAHFEMWKPEYWYAAAHEDTVCDGSHGTHSSFVHNDDRGPTVWISRGKHASYLDREMCRGGCGDDCSEMRLMDISKIVNIGEPGSPMNGMSWVEWPGWVLVEKMRTDFTPAVLARLNAEDRQGIIPVNDSQGSVKGTIHVSGATAGALSKANSKTGSALSKTSDAVGKSMDQSTIRTGNALSRTFKAIWRALGGSTEDKKTEEND